MIPLVASSAVLPPPDEFGLPGPAWLFELLMLLTLLLHLVFMNFTLGGALAAAGLDVLTLLGRGSHELTVRIIWQAVPVTLSLTITTGVAPLLFVQVLFGHFFYPANVLMGFTWLAMAGVLLGAFYLAYLLCYRLGSAVAQRAGRWDRRPGRRLPLALAVAALFLANGWILTNNHMLEIQPDAWPRGGRWAQNRLAVSPALTVPRYLHLVGGALAVSGVWLAAIGHWRRRRRVDPPQVALAITRTGLWLALPLIGVAAALGPGLYFTLPAEVRASLLLPGVYAGLWWLGLLCVPGQVAAGIAALRRPAEFRWFALLVGLLVVALVGMLGGREQVRLGFLAREPVGFSLAQWRVYAQSSPAIVFGVLLALALALTAWLVWISVRARPQTSRRQAER